MNIKPQAQVALFFALTQVLGIFTGVVLIQAAAANEELRELSVAPMAPNDPMNAVVFLVYILFGAAMVMIAAKLFKGRTFFRLLELVVITSSSSVVFFAAALAIGGLDVLSALGVGMVFGIALGGVKFFWDDLKNTAAIISSAGVAALFGYSLGFLPTALFVILLSIYDYIAVFKTRHMIEMARELSTRQLSFAVTAKQVPDRKPHEKREEYVDRAMREGERLDLGTGDLSVPAMMSVSAYTLGPNGLIYALAIAAGSTLSIYLLLQFVAKQRVFLPALQPICLGGMLSFLLVKLAGF